MGGYEAIDARDQLARDSSNWMQYKLTRDRQVFADDLEMRVNTKWSQFSTKEDMSDYLSQKRTESMEERESVRYFNFSNYSIDVSEHYIIRSSFRAMVRSKISKDTMTKSAYEISKNPWAAEECEEESKKKVEASMSREERIAKLRQVTEDMLSHKSDYSQSAKALAMAAYKVKDLFNEITKG